ncbi:MAG: response regulator [SAR324 cluster bacterium]|nr:response regulator [SAR324 cluster bacterium]
MADKPLEKIMCVEDEPDIQEIVKMALEEVGGYTVKLCDSGEKALETVGEFAPDLILLDVMMPGMDGPTTMKVLRERADSADIPVILMTAKVQPHEVAQYREQGALDVISKPFDPMTLSATIESMWQNRDEAG